MPGCDGRCDPDAKCDYETEHKVDTHHAANRLHHGANFTAAPEPCNPLNVGITEARSDDAPSADDGSSDHPQPILRSSQLVQDDRCRQQHSEGIGCIVQNAVDGICEVPS